MEKDWLWNVLTLGEYKKRLDDILRLHASLSDLASKRAELELEVSKLTLTLSNTSKDSLALAESINELNDRISTLNADMSSIQSKLEVANAQILRLSQQTGNTDDMIPDDLKQIFVAHYAKYPDVDITYGGRYFGARIDNTYEQDVKSWCLQGQNDWMIQNKIKAAGAYVKDILPTVGNDFHKACDLSVLKVAKIISPNYYYDINTYGVNEYWAYPTETFHLNKGDCLEENTLLTDSEYNFIPISDIEVGTSILGKDGCFTKVMKKWDKGFLPCFKLTLSNGGWLVATAEHKMFRADGSECKLQDLKIGDTLLTSSDLESVASISAPSDFDDGWLEGVFVADGWSESYRIAISGKDGFPKEEQKRRVLAIASARGWSTRWHERYICINERFLAEKFVECGIGAKNKHVRNLLVSKEYRDGLKEGLKADAHVTESGTVVQRTINRKLALQLRLLYGFDGIRVSLREIPASLHRGFGTNSIFEVTTQAMRPRPIHVIGIEEVGPKHVYDIETANKGIYLVESGIVVHNCDDWAHLRYVCYRIAGVPKQMLRVSCGNTRGGEGHLTNHYFASDRKWHHVNSTSAFGSTTDILKTPLHTDSSDSIGLSWVWFSYNEEKAWHVIQTDAQGDSFNKNRKEGFMKYIKIYKKENGIERII